MEYRTATIVYCLNSSECSMPRSKEGFQWTPTSVTVGLETQAVIPSTPESELKSSYDVIIIGAGYTGLTAARDISLGHGSNVLLVDARDRIGGRTWTASALGENFEMGGTWVHWYDISKQFTE